MYMNLKPKQHKRITFNITTMTSLEFIGRPKNFRTALKFSFPPPPPQIKFFAQVPPSPNYFGLKFSGPP